MRGARRQPRLELAVREARWQDGPDVVAVSFPAAGLLRIRVLPAGEGRPWSYAIERPPRPARIEGSGGARPVVAANGLRAAIDVRARRVVVSDGGRETIADLRLGAPSAGTARTLTRRLVGCEAVLGLGEKTGRLDKRGRTWGFWNTDVVLVSSSARRDRFPDDADPLYVSVPLAIVVERGRATGLFLDHPGACAVDVARGRRDALTVSSEVDGLDAYVLAGPTVADVVRRFTALTGRAALPPLWALGYHQCRYSYRSGAEVRRIAAELRARELPCDAVWLDIHYMDRFRDFTWDPRRFSRPGRLVRDLRRRGLRTVAIVDPGLAIERGYRPYEEARRRGVLCRDEDGGVAEGRVWPGQCVFPDFTSADARALWSELHEPLLATGIAGIWDDMNEPTLGRDGRRRPYDDRRVRYDDGGRRSPAAAVRNAYGSLMAQASREALLARRPDERPFVLTRAGYAGVQRHAAVWTGDLESTWAQLRMHVAMLLGLGLSGIGVCGSDVGGFLGHCGPELLVRWFEADFLTPFFRNHAHRLSRPQEPWTYGPEVEAAVREHLRLRYALLPYLYTAVAACAATGDPVLRPLAWAAPGDRAALRVEDAFFVGPDLLQAPVLEPRARGRRAYLPRGRYLDFRDGRAYEGGRAVRLAAPLDRTPLLARAGSVVPMVEPAQHTGALDHSRLVLRTFAGPAGASWRGEVYDDDGETREHERGVLARVALATRSTGSRTVLSLGAARGRYQLRWTRLALDLVGFPPLGGAEAKGRRGTLQVAPAGDSDAWQRLEIVASAADLPVRIRLDHASPRP